MKSYIVVEGSFDAELLTTLVKELLPGQDVVVADAGGQSNAVALARSLLLSRNRPLVLALDADTVDPQSIQRRRQDIEALLGMAADPSLWRLILFEPEIEITIMSDVGFAERLFGAKLTPEQRVLIPYAPKRVLNELMRENLSAANGNLLVQRLSGVDLRPLRTAPAIREIVDFLSAMSQRSAA